MFQLYNLISLFPLYWQWQRELEEFHNRILILLKDIDAGCAIELAMVSIHARHAIEYEFYSYSRAELKCLLFYYKLIIIVDKLVLKSKKVYLADLFHLTKK